MRASLRLCSRALGWWRLTSQPPPPNKSRVAKYPSSCWLTHLHTNYMGISVVQKKQQNLGNSSGHDVFYSSADTRDRAKFCSNRRIFGGPPGEEVKKIICNIFAISLVRHLKVRNIPATHAYYIHCHIYGCQRRLFGRR